MGLVVFGNEGKSEFFLKSHPTKTSLRAAVEKVAYLQENTNTSGGIKVMRLEQFTADHGDRSDADNIAIIITGMYYAVILPW